ncbi:MAG: motility protein A [Bdellovibrionales bacterium]
MVNYYSLTALFLTICVFFVGVFTATDSTSAFVDYHAALIVFGGTGAVAALSFRLDRIYLLLKVFYFRVVKSSKIEYVPVIRDLMLVAEAYRKNDPNLDQIVSELKDPFMKECVEMLREELMTHDELYSVLSIRVQTIYNRYGEDAKKFKALGKFPPAMGLMGAVLGMIALLQKLGQPGAEKNVGPAMAIAMVATLYGIAFANLIILPIGENLMEGTRQIYTKNRMIVEGVRLIAQRKNRVLLAEELNSYLLANERLDWKKIELKKAA